MELIIVTLCRPQGSGFGCILKFELAHLWNLSEVHISFIYHSSIIDGTAPRFIIK